MADENNQQQNQGTTEPNKAPVIDEAKITSMINDRVKGVEGSILKEYFKKQGLSEEEMGSAIDAYKQNKSKISDEQAKAQQATNKELEELRAYKRNTIIQTGSKKVAKDMGIADDRIDAIVKLTDTSNFMDDKGNLSEEAIQTAFSKTLEDYPFLKVSGQAQDQQPGGFKQVGADMGSQQQANGFNFQFGGVRPHKQ